VDRVAQLADRVEIGDLLSRYARMVDDRDWDLMDEVFAPGATLDYTSTGGKSGPYRETLEWLARALEPWPLNLHFISNVEIEFGLDGDSARSRCYFQAPMGRASEGGGQLVISNAGRYEDDLVRTPDGWRIASRVCQQTIMIGQLPEGYVIPE
jgi:3-phenylpropionate/cinnamic acid dioxygenase small subunit